AIDRSEVLQRSVRAQADAQLRPGADASRADAELASVRTQLTQAQQAAAVAKAVLAQFVRIPPQEIVISAPRLRQLPVDESMPAFKFSENPIALEQNALIDQKKEELRSLEKSYVPRLFAQLSAYSRGTGARIDGTRLGGLGGLAPDTQNYALGFTLTFP